MKVCILGDGLTSLTLAQAIVNLGINVDVVYQKKIKKYNKSRTLGISENNVKFYNENILKIQKILWEIKKIEIYTDNLKNEKILDFEKKNKNLFSVVKNYELYELLLSSLKKNKFFNFKKDKKNKFYLNKNYNLIINCDQNHLLTKKIFFKKIKKNYNSYAYITTIKHTKLDTNSSAVQIFTKNGPFAFLPISKNETSIVYSAKGKNRVNLIDLIKKYNKTYDIIKIGTVESFKLNSSNLRSYHSKNILAFGELLHKIHPLAGQGFNMIIRDIKEIIKLIEKQKNLGLEIDSSICYQFERNTRHRNLIFSSGVDFVYEFFNLESKTDNKILSKTIKFLGDNKYLNNYFIKFADEGIIF